MNIIKRMRNIYKSYKLCKYILENSTPHMCEDKNKLMDKGCKSLMKNGVSDLSSILKVKPNNPKKNKPFGYFTYQEYAKKKGYIITYECRNNNETFSKLTTTGLELTDNVFLPFTPVGLWKEIWKEHKIFFTVVPGLITIITGTGLGHGIRWIVTRIV